MWFDTYIFISTSLVEILHILFSRYWPVFSYFPLSICTFSSNTWTSTTLAPRDTAPSKNSPSVSSHALPGHFFYRDTCPCNIYDTAHSDADALKTFKKGKCWKGKGRKGKCKSYLEFICHTLSYFGTIFCIDKKCISIVQSRAMQRNIGVSKIFICI